MDNSNIDNLINNEYLSGLNLEQLLQLFENGEVFEELINKLYTKELDIKELPLVNQALKQYFFDTNDREIKMILSDIVTFDENELKENITNENIHLFDKLLLAKDNTEMIVKSFILAGYEEKIAQRFLNLYSINEHLITTINLDILDNDMLYHNLENKIEVITCFPEIQQMILDLSDSKLEIFIRCIKDYENQIDEWKPITEKLLINLSSNKFDG